MSIKIGQIYTNNYNEIFELNTINEYNSNIIELNNNINYLDKDTLINFKNRYILGYSSNNYFDLIYNPDKKKIFNISSNNIIINNDVNINGNIILNSNIIINLIDCNDSFKITSNNHNVLNLNNDYFYLNINSNIITINSNSFNVSNIYSHDIYTNYIRNNDNSKIKIYNAELFNFNINNIIYDVSLDIINDQNTFNNSNILFNRPSFTINKIKNGYNLVEFSSDNNKILSINENGFIGIGNFNNFPLTIINPLNTTSNIIYYSGNNYISDKFIVSSNGNIGIGYINNPESFIDIYRIDDYINQKIRTNPIININIDYSCNLNFNNDHIDLKYYSYGYSNILYDLNDNILYDLYNNYTIDHQISIYNTTEPPNTITNYNCIFYLKHNDYIHELINSDIDLSISNYLTIKLVNNLNNIIYGNFIRGDFKDKTYQDIIKIHYYIYYLQYSDLNSHIRIDNTDIIILIIDNNINITANSYSELNTYITDNINLFNYSIEYIEIFTDYTVTVNKYIYKKNYYNSTIYLNSSSNLNKINYNPPKIFESKYNSNIYFSLSHDGNMILGSNINPIYNNYDNYKLFINGNIKTNKIECNDILSIKGKNNINFGYCNISNINSIYSNSNICNFLKVNILDTNNQLIDNIVQKLIDNNGIDDIITNYFISSNLNLFINENHETNFNNIKNTNSNLINYSNIFYNNGINVNCHNSINPSINLMSYNENFPYINFKNSNVEYNIRLSNYSSNINKFEILNNNSIIIDNYFNDFSNINITGIGNNSLLIDTNKFAYISNSNFFINRFNITKYQDHSFNISMGFPSQLLNCSYQYWINNYLNDYKNDNFDIFNYSLNLFGNVNISTTSNLPMLKIKNSLDNNINIGIGTNPNNNFLLYINGKTNINDILNTNNLGINLTNYNSIDTNTFSTFSILNNGSFYNKNNIITTNLGIGSTSSSFIIDKFNTYSLYNYGNSLFDGNLTINNLFSTSNICSFTRINGNIIITNNATITNNLNVGSITYNSDIRLKKNINYIHNSLNIINNIKGYSYLFNNDIDIIDNYKYGFLAQEIKNILPNSVKLNNNGFYSIEYNNIIPLLVNSIHDLTNKINILEKKLENFLEID